MAKICTDEHRCTPRSPIESILKTEKISRHRVANKLFIIYIDIFTITIDIFSFDITGHHIICSSFISFTFLPDPQNIIIPNCIYRSEEHTSELQSRENIVCRLLHEKKKYNIKRYQIYTL